MYIDGSAHIGEVRVSTGIAGLDSILGGGLPKHRLYLVQGDPGVGKTTLALQFLMAGAAAGERVLYITLSESRLEIEEVADSHGWSFQNVEVCEYTPEDLLEEQRTNTVFHSSEVELCEMIKKLLTAVDRSNPSRVVFDSLSELMLLASEPLRYRREIMYLKQYFANRNCTVLLLDDLTANGGDRQLHSLCHGVISLEDHLQDYGPARNRLRVSKLRGVNFKGGYHDYVIKTGGVEVFPRLVAADHRAEPSSTQYSSGIRQLDKLLGGGLDSGASVALIGPSGSGKSTIATKFVHTACDTGHSTAIFMFEESKATLYKRSSGLGMDLRPFVDNGLLKLHSIDPAEVAPTQFTQMVKAAVEIDNVSLIVVDSLNGFMHAMPGERNLILLVHEMLSYLSQKDVTCIFIVAQQGILATSQSPILDISYIADTVIQFRYFEHSGNVRQAISVFKRRSGEHERSIRELTIGGPDGIAISEPLRNFRGLLTGVPMEETPISGAPAVLE